MEETLRGALSYNVSNHYSLPSHCFDRHLGRSRSCGLQALEFGWLVPVAPT
jgi:hypothetical protein